MPFLDYKTQFHSSLVNFLFPGLNPIVWPVKSPFWTKNNDDETASQPRVQTGPLNRLGHRVPLRLGSRHSGSRYWDGHSAFEPIPEGKSVQKCELYANSLAF